MLCRNVLLNLHVFVFLTVFFLFSCNWYLAHSVVVREDAWYDYNFLKFTDTWFETQDVVYPGNVPCALEKKVYSSALGWNVLKISMSYISSNISFKSEWTPGVGDGLGGLVCCDSWGHKESGTTEWLNWTELNLDVPWSAQTQHASNWLSLPFKSVLCFFTYGTS